MSFSRLVKGHLESIYWLHYGCLSRAESLEAMEAIEAMEVG